MKYNVKDTIRIPVKKTGQGVGGATTENLVPCDMLDSHNGIEIV